MTNEETKARELLLSIYENRRDEIRVSPLWMATAAMNVLDPLRASHPIEYAMAHLQFRQLAREICRGKWEPDADDGEPRQHNLFPELQTRYPSARSRLRDKREYVLLEYLGQDDVDYNVHRLRMEGRAKLDHADALLAWWAQQSDHRRAED